MLDRREIGRQFETSRGDPLFLNTGITLDTLSAQGKTPAEKDLLIKVEIGSEISRLSSLRTLTGILFGPEDFEAENEPITLAISSGDVGVKKME